ncbi:MAG: ParB/RepB/Spo0J family partition protein [Anaerolineae bacterium]|jgi:ParB family chromosome partitioning protein|nr:ParB/RepB/Spo0J family partition protein [Anaerolineae bacterium]
MARRGLGRGLDILIPGGDAAEGLIVVPIDAITPNPRQPRTKVLESSLTELAASIREHGVIQPLVVTRAADGGYQLIAGERRWRASRLAGLEDVPVIVKEAAPQDMLALALVENIQRADLNPLEEALAFQHLVEDFGLSQGEVAQRVGKSRSAVTNLMRLLSASSEVQQALLDGEITEGHGRALLGLATAEAQTAALGRVLQKQLSVRETEALVRRLRAFQESGSPSTREPEDPQIRALEERFCEALGTRVRLRHNKQQGRVVIYYYSDEEFQALYRRITGEEL